MPLVYFLLVIFLCLVPYAQSYIFSQNLTLNLLLQEFINYL